MQAIVHDRYGPPDEALQLREVDTPVAGDGEVLVAVHAAGVAIGDWLIINGLPYIARPGYGLPRPKNRIAGLEAAGRVAAVGANVTRFQPGDAVFGWCDGALAEHAAVPADQLVDKPDAVSFEQAAAIPISGFAALQAVRDTGEVRPGQTVVILGASGAVGTFAVQIAKALGAEVTGVCSTRNVDLVASLGADHVIDYTTQDIGQSGQRYDVIVDMAGNRPLSDLRHALAPDGTLVIVGSSGGRWLMGFDRTIRALAVSPFVRGQRLRAFFSTPKHQDLVVLKEFAEAGKVTPVIDKTYELSDTAAALGHIAQRHTQGKTVITVSTRAD